MTISIERTKHSGYCLYDGNDCMLLIHGDSGRAETFAEIERRVNRHEQLVAALEAALNRLEHLDELMMNETGSQKECELGEVTRGRALLQELAA